MHSVIAVIPILLFQFDECRFSAPREAVLDAVDAVRIQVQAGAGHLRVEGIPGLQQARLRGTACASDRTLLDDIKLLARRIGNELFVNANDQEIELAKREYARLNLVIEVPEHIAAAIDDGMGHMELFGLGAIDVKDESGSIHVDDAHGTVTIDDGSGDITLSNIYGNVNVIDGSGEVEISGVEGSVDVRDGSGAIKLSQVSRAVTIADGSGDIKVDGVGGDFTVRNDAGGDIDFRSVRGTVRVPVQREHSRHWLRLFRE